MSPYYEDDFVTIYHGDCRDILPELRGDLVLTDLPYGVGIDYGSEYKHDTQRHLDWLVADSFPLLQQAAPVVALTCGVANVWRYPPARWILCWYMANAVGGRGYWGFSQWQPILVYGKDPYLSRGMGARPDLIITAAPNNGADKLLGHPCPKPLEAWSKILLRLSPHRDDLIIDPFAGSGSTLAAAKYSGRKAIGIEISERFCEIAAGRCAQEVLDVAV